MWHFNIDSLTGHRALDVPETFFQEFQASIEAQLWSQAAKHYGGTGMENGVCNFNLWVPTPPKDASTSNRFQALQ